jgi:hypothetical protein
VRTPNRKGEIVAARGSKKTSARKGRSNPLARLARLEERLPPTLREFADALRRRLDRLERELAKTRAEARTRSARLLRETSHELGRLEAGGEASWRKLGASYRRELLALRRRLEATLAPATRKRLSAPKRMARSTAGSRVRSAR